MKNGVIGNFFDFQETHSLFLFISSKKSLIPEKILFFQIHFLILVVNIFSVLKSSPTGMVDLC